MQGSKIMPQLMNPNSDSYQKMSNLISKRTTLLFSYYVAQQHSSLTKHENFAKNELIVYDGIFYLIRAQQTNTIINSPPRPSILTGFNQKLSSENVVSDKKEASAAADSQILNEKNRRQKFVPQVLQEIVEIRRKGGALRDIAAQFNIHYPAIPFILLHSLGDVFSKIVQNVTDLRNKGLSGASLAEKLKVPDGTIDYFYLSGLAKCSPDVTLRIMDDRINRFNINLIAKKFDISVEILRKVFGNDEMKLNEFTAKASEKEAKEENAHQGTNRNNISTVETSRPINSERVSNTITEKLSPGQDNVSTAIFAESYLISTETQPPLLVKAPALRKSDAECHNFVENNLTIQTPKIIQKSKDFSAKEMAERYLQLLNALNTSTKQKPLEKRSIGKIWQTTSKNLKNAGANISDLNTNCSFPTLCLPLNNSMNTHEGQQKISMDIIKRVILGRKQGMSFENIASELAISLKDVLDIFDRMEKRKEYLQRMVLRREPNQVDSGLFNSTNFYQTAEIIKMVIVGRRKGMSVENIAQSLRLSLPDVLEIVHRIAAKRAPTREPYKVDPVIIYSTANLKMDCESFEMRSQNPSVALRSVYMEPEPCESEFSFADDRSIKAKSKVSKKSTRKQHFKLIIPKLALEVLSGDKSDDYGMLTALDEIYDCKSEGHDSKNCEDASKSFGDPA